MLALFSGTPYVPPSRSNNRFDVDLRPHLTNTCLQTDAYGAPRPLEELVKLFWELEGLTAISSTATGVIEEMGKVDREWLDRTFAAVGEVVAESVQAGAECGSFGLQLVPNAFEVLFHECPSMTHHIDAMFPDLRCRPSSLLPPSRHQPPAIATHSSRDTT